MTIQRYDIREESGRAKVTRTSVGDFVSYADYEALVAENSALKSAHPQPFGREMMRAIDAYEKHQDEVPETGMLDAFFILRDSINLRTPATAAALAELRMKFGGRCAYCGCELGDKWHADHVDPVIRFDGKMLHAERDELRNLAPACHQCNLHKHCNSLEDYRRIINDGRREFLVSGKGKALVRMGLVSMKPDPVVFWFERYQQEAL